MEPRAIFSIAGIPISIDPFFLIGAFFIYSWSGGGRAGTFTVIALLVFVLIHELGHALTAKSFGATTAITITFMGGFASYSAKRELAGWQQNLISVMGPAAELVSAIPFLWLSQHLARNAGNQAELEFAFDLYWAVAWAGVLLAFLNLVPLWPLDGGHIAERVITRVFGKRATTPYLYASLIASILLFVLYIVFQATETGGFVADSGRDMASGFYESPLAAVWLILQAVPGRLVGAGFFIPLFCVIGSFARLQHLRRGDAWAPRNRRATEADGDHEEAVRAVRDAERAGWQTATVPTFPKRWGPSPWLLAHISLIRGLPKESTRHLSRLAEDHRNWLLDRDDRPELERLLGLVPAGAARSLAVLEVRVHHGSLDDCVALANALFEVEGTTEPLYLGAAGLAVRGRYDEAIAWLAMAVDLGPDPARIATTREFRDLHRRPDFQRLLGEAERAIAVRTPSPFA